MVEIKTLLYILGILVTFVCGVMWGVYITKLNK